LKRDVAYPVVNYPVNKFSVGYFTTSNGKNAGNATIPISNLSIAYVPGLLRDGTGSGSGA